MSGCSGPKRIAIVTASPPGENGVGQNYIRDLVETIGDHQLHVFALLRDDREWRGEDRRCVGGHTLFARRYEYAGGVGTGRFNSWSATAAFYLMTVRHARRLSKEITENVSSAGFDAVLVVLESPLLMLIGAWLCKHLPCPVHILVWDHPDHLSTSFGHQGLRKRHLLAAFSTVISNAASGLTVSKALRALISKSNPELPTRLFRSPARVHQANRTGDRESESQAFVIGFAGSVTAPEELDLLQRSLDQLQWKVDDLPIVLRLFGKRFTLSASVGRNVQYHGFLPTQVDVVNELAECNVCFLPQPFASSGRLVATYSFPTKVSSYLSAGRPVLVLAPPHASLSAYQRDRKSQPENESPFGFHCDSSDPNALAGLIRRIVSDREFYLGGCRRAQACADTSFRSDAGALNVRAALGITEVDTGAPSRLP